MEHILFLNKIIRFTNIIQRTRINYTFLEQTTYLPLNVSDIVSHKPEIPLQRIFKTKFIHILT